MSITYMGMPKIKVQTFEEKTVTRKRIKSWIPFATGSKYCVYKAYYRSDTKELYFMDILGNLCRVDLNDPTVVTGSEMSSSPEFKNNKYYKFGECYYQDYPFNRWIVSDEIYECDFSGECNLVGNMSIPRGQTHTLTIPYDGESKIVIAGGKTTDGNPTTLVELFDANTKTIESLGNYFPLIDGVNTACQSMVFKNSKVAYLFIKTANSKTITVKSLSLTDYGITDVGTITISDVKFNDVTDFPIVYFVPLTMDSKEYIVVTYTDVGGVSRKMVLDLNLEQTDIEIQYESASCPKPMYDWTVEMEDNVPLIGHWSEQINGKYAHALYNSVGSMYKPRGLELAVIKPISGITADKPICVKPSNTQLSKTGVAVIEPSDTVVAFGEFKVYALKIV